MSAPFQEFPAGMATNRIWIISRFCGKCLRNLQWSWFADLAYVPAKEDVFGFCGQGYIFPQRSQMSASLVLERIESPPLPWRCGYTSWLAIRELENRF